MPSPITRRQRELCNLAIVIAQQQESIEGLQRYLRRLHDAKEGVIRRAGDLTEERAALLAENAELRAEIEWLESVVHAMADDRWASRFRERRLIRKLHTARFGGNRHAST